MSGFQETLRQYNTAACEARRLRKVLALRFGFDCGSMETMRKILTKQTPPNLPPRPPLMSNGLRPRRGSIF